VFPALLLAEKRQQVLVSTAALQNKPQHVQHLMCVRMLFQCDSFTLRPIDTCALRCTCVGDFGGVNPSQWPFAALFVRVFIS
jgi:hypothetical protein